MEDCAKSIVNQKCVMLITKIKVYLKVQIYFWTKANYYVRTRNNNNKQYAKTMN